MSDPIKVFSQVYVGLREQYQREGEEAPAQLGFLTPYEQNSAGRKRIETVNIWATPSDQYRWDPVKKESVLFKKAEVIPPKILDNVPLEGFEICREVKRTGWNGGNVVWRVLDPRGFELEISSANMAKILTFATIEAGTIKGKCIWGRLGANNLLMPEGCPEYSNIIPKAEEFSVAKTLKGKLIPNSEIKIGDFIQLHNRAEGFYLGKWSFFQDKGHEFIGGNVVVRHVVYSDSEFYVVSELKVLSKPDAPADIKKPEFATVSELEQYLNKIKRFRSFGTASDVTPRLVSAQKIDPEKVKLVVSKYDKETFMADLRKGIAGKVNYFSDLFKIADFQKLEMEHDWRYLTLLAKHSSGKMFRPADIEVSQNDQMFNSKHLEPFQPKVDAGVQARVIEKQANGFVKPSRANFTLRNRQYSGSGFYYGSGREFYSQCVAGSKKECAESQKQAVIDFFENEVEEIYYYSLELEVADGVVISNTLYL